MISWNAENATSLFYKLLRKGVIYELWEGIEKARYHWHAVAAGQGIEIVGVIYELGEGIEVS
ncbi:hypothetical protein OROMI_012709 [Orobanche minor]